MVATPFTPLPRGRVFYPARRRGLSPRQEVGGQYDHRQEAGVSMIMYSSHMVIHYSNGYFILFAITMRFTGKSAGMTVT